MQATIPSKPFDLATEHPGCGSATTKLVELQSKRHRVNADLNDVLDAQRVTSRSNRTGIDIEAAALLDDAPRDAAYNAVALREQIVALQHERAVLTRAIELQRRIVEDAEIEASREIAMRLVPAHRALVGEIAEALIALGSALAKEADLAMLLRESGVRYSTDILRPMGIHNLGDPRDRNSTIAVWLREAVEFQLISETSIPQTWRLRWR